MEKIYAKNKLGKFLLPSPVSEPESTLMYVSVPRGLSSFDWLLTDNSTDLLRSLK